VQSPKVKKLVSLFSRLPGVGEKTAQRYVLHLLTADEAIAKELGAELGTLHDELRPCVRCGNIAEVTAGSDAVCAICKDSKRDPQVLCIVGRVHDLFAIERTGAMPRPLLRPSAALLSPLEGIGPDDLPLPRLVKRINAEGVIEVIVATPPSVDGEATALLLKARALADRRQADADRERRPPRRRPRNTPIQSRWAEPFEPPESVGAKAMRPITTLTAPAAIGPYSQAIDAGDFVFLSGQVPIDPVTGELVKGGIAVQTERVLDNLGAVLEAAGCSFADVVKTTIYLMDLNDFQTVNATYAKRFTSAPPARATGAGLGATEGRPHRNRRDRKEEIEDSPRSVPERDSVVKL